MDLNSILDMTFVGLMTVGFVNVFSFFKPDADSRVKFALSVLFAFAMTFVPAEVGVVILDKAKVAVSAAFAMSGVYKIAQKAGGS